MSTFRTAIYSGAGAALASLAAVMVLSRLEGHSALRPLNATSHVIWGEDDAPKEEADLPHTLPGVLINMASAFFWGAIFASLAPGKEEHTDGRLIGRAFATSLIAALVDYGLMPKRLRPGWELALRARSVMAALAAMGAGLAAGGLAARRAEISQNSK